jgi:hypothetical protein
VEDGYCLGDDVESVVVAIDNGNVDIRAGGSAQQCVAVDLGGLGSGGQGQRIENGVLYLDYDCDGLCGGDIEVIVPRRVDVDVRLGAGDVKVDERAGRVVVQVGAGSITGTDLRNGFAEFVVGTGSISAEWTQRPDDINAEVATGSIDILVPNGDYILDLSAPGGSVVVSETVIDSMDADASIFAQTDVGSISIQGHGSRR